MCKNMGSQRKISLDVHLLGPCWFLTSILLAMALLLPAVSLDSLLCYYCPLQQKGKSCTNLTSQCLPGQRCSSSRGHYLFLHILSAQGCLDAGLCGSHQITTFRGVMYNVSHTCCCKDKCNSRLNSKANLEMMKDTKDNTNRTNVLQEDLWDSCANYTLSRTTVPATAS